MRLHTMAALISAMAAAGCSTAHGTSFGLPDAALAAVDTTSIDAVRTSIDARRADYVEAANGAINGSQKFDIATIISGTAGVASAAFNLTNDLTPSAGTIAAGAIGMRTYYNSGARYPAYVGAARGLSCLQQLAGAYKAAQLDSLTGDWTAIGASADVPTAAREDGLRNSARLGTVAWRLASAAARIDDEVLRKLAAPTAPNLAAFHQTYEAAVRSGEQQRQADNASFAAASNSVAKLRSDANQEGVAQIPRNPQLLALADRVARAYAGAVVLRMETELDAKVEQCVALAA